MNPSHVPNGERALCQTDDRRTRNARRFGDDASGFVHAQLAEQFEVSIPNVSMHPRPVYEDGELVERTTLKPHWMVRSERTQFASERVPQ